MVHVIIGIGQHRHLKSIGKAHNYSIVFDNRLFLLHFQHGPKSICTLFYNPARQLVCIIYTVDATFVEKIYLYCIWRKNNTHSPGKPNPLITKFWGIPICQCKGILLG